VATLSETLPAASHIDPNRIAHVLVRAVNGFKQSAATADDMRRLIDELLLLAFGPG
jgi:hypothetical protein